MGSVIFILLVATVFVWLYSILKGQRRKPGKTMSPHSRAEKAEMPDFDDLAAETPQEKSAAGETGRYVYVGGKTKEKRIRPEKSDVHVSCPKEHSENGPKEASPEKNWAEQLNLADADNAKKAFIASELLKRKY